jgi:hypothetical protein
MKITRLDKIKKFGPGGKVGKLDYTGMGNDFVTNWANPQVQRDYYSQTQPDDPNRQKYVGGYPVPIGIGSSALNSVNAVSGIAKKEVISKARKIIDTLGDVSDEITDTPTGSLAVAGYGRLFEEIPEILNKIESFVNKSKRPNGGYIENPAWYKSNAFAMKDGGFTPNYTGMGNDFMSQPNHLLDQTRPIIPGEFPKYIGGMAPTPGLFNKQKVIESLLSTYGKDAQEILKKELPSLSKDMFDKYAKKAGYNSLGKYYTPSSVQNLSQYPLGGQISSRDLQRNTTAGNYANTIQQAQKSVAGMIPGANIVSPVAGAVAGFIDKDDAYGVSKDWTSGVRGAIDPSMSLSRAAGDIGAGKFDWNTAADLAFPILGEIMNNKDNRRARDLANVPQQKVPIPGYQPTFPMGGVTPNGVPGVPVELEKEEVFQTPDGQMGQVDGPSHSQGGVDMNLPPETFVWSDKLKSSSGRTFAQEAAYLAKQKSKYEKILNG